jgi:2-dehydro-3-deoxygluconokinase
MTGRVVTFGETMLRLAAPHHQRLLQSPMLEATFGGSESNVAIGLALMGVDAMHVTVLPEKNPLTETCVGELRRHGVDVSGIVRAPGRFGIYYLESGANQRPPRVLYDRENSAMAMVKPGQISWGRIFKGASWFHISEITPAISSSAAEAALEAVKTARKANLTVSCDLNHRANLWRWGKEARDVMPELMRWTDVVIGNRETMEVVLGVQAGRDLKAISKKALKVYPGLRAVALTQRISHSASHNSWAACFFDGRKLYQSRRYEITHIVDRIGGGDAFDAGLIYGLMKLGDGQESIEFATAAAVLKHAIPGDFTRCSVDEVMDLLRNGGSGKVRR